MTQKLPSPALLHEASTVEIFSPAFNEFIQKMCEMMNVPSDNGALIESLRGYVSTTRLLESKEVELRNILSNPRFIIQAFTSAEADKVLVLAYLAEAIKIVHERCAQADQEMAFV